MGARLTKPRQATDGVSLVKPSKDADKLVELPILLKKHRSRSRAESAAVKVLDAVKRPSSVKGRTMKDILKTFSNDPLIRFYSGDANPKWGFEMKADGEIEWGGA